MVLHAPPHARHLMHQPDAMRRDGVGRADTRPQQHSRALVRAKAKDDVVGLVGDPLAGGLADDLEARGARAVEHQAVDAHAHLEGEVVARERRVEVVISRRLPLAITHVERRGADSHRPGCVVVGHPLMTPRDRRLGEALDQRVPGVARMARDGNGPVVAVVGLVAEVRVGLDEPEPRQHGLPVEPRRKGGPVVVVLGQAAQGDGRVGDRGAPHHLPAWHVHTTRRGPGLCREAPVVGLLDDAVRVRQLGRPLARPVVRTALQQHHLDTRVGRQARGQHAPGGSGSGDDDAHAASPRVTRRPGARRRSASPARS